MNTSELMRTRPVGTIDEKDVKVISTSLNELLANEYGLFTKTLNYHWNITGPRFNSLHTYLEGHYKELLVVIDGVAERIRTLGETPYSTVKSMNEAMALKESNGRDLSSSEMIQDLFKSNIEIQTSIKSLVRKDSLFKDDPVTEDFLIGLLKKHEMMSWTLKSHLD